METKPDSAIKGKPRGAQREARRAAALRENLRRRKNQVEAREDMNDGASHADHA